MQEDLYRDRCNCRQDKSEELRVKKKHSDKRHEANGKQTGKKKKGKRDRRFQNVFLTGILRCLYFLRKMPSMKRISGSCGVL